MANILQMFFALFCIFLMVLHRGESSRKVQNVRNSEIGLLGLNQLQSRSVDTNTLSQNHKQRSSGRQVTSHIADDVYVAWTTWSSCGRSCRQHRLRRCRKPDICDTHVIKEKRTCLKKLKRGRKCRKHTHKGVGGDERAKSVKGRLEDIVYGLFYYDWSAWSECSPTCKKRRYRMCALWRWCRNTVMLEEETCCETDSSKSEEKKTEAKRTDTADGHYYAQLGFNYRLEDEKNKKHQQQQQHKQSEEEAEEVEGEVEVEGKVEVEVEEEDYDHQQSKPERHHNHRYNFRPRKPHNSGKHDRGRTTPAPEAEDETDEIPTDCGVPNITRSLRIIGGSESTPGKWPWQVAILTRWREQYCGGVLLSPRYVLTAAHCVRKRGRRRKVIIRAGEFDLGQYDQFEMDVKVATDYVHPDFNLSTIDSDIALLRLRVPVTRSKYHGYACLPKANTELPPKTNCYIMGWGKTKNTHIYGVDVMRETPIPLVRDRVCQRAFNYEITPNQMCAGYRRGGVDTCAGDSGGPLMCQYTDDAGVKRWHVYGVTSFGEGCGEKGKYGIYTKVPKFVDWIVKTMTKSRKTD